MDIIASQSSWANSFEINPEDNTKEEKAESDMLLLAYREPRHGAI